MNPRVVLIGNFRQTHCSEVHFARTYEALGCEVLRLQEDEQTPETIEKAAHDFDADLTHYTRTWGLPSEVTDVWRRLEVHGIRTCSYHLDLYLGLKREATLANDPFWSTQYVFSADGDPGSQAKFEAMGINHHWMPPATQHDECVIGERRPKYDHDVVFVGSAAYHPEWEHRVQLVNWCKRRYASRFAHYGGDGQSVVRDRALNNLYASVKVAVGDSLCLPGHTNYWSDRLTETLGRGGVLVFPDIPGMAEQGFRPGMHYLSYEIGDWQTLKQRIDWCIANPEDARAMALRGQRFVRERHTYAHRLASALHIMGLRDSPEPPKFEIVEFGKAVEVV